MRTSPMIEHEIGRMSADARRVLLQTHLLRRCGKWPAGAVAYLISRELLEPAGEGHVPTPMGLQVRGRICCLIREGVEFPGPGPARPLGYAGGRMEGQ